jgi:hypothetical protein
MNPECQFWWNWWVQFAVAVGTFLTVAAALFIALYGEKLRAKYFPPLLSLKLGKPEGERTQLKDQNGAYIDDVRYYYVEVSNARRWSRADQTQVFLIRIEEPGPSGNLQITWSGDIPIRWRNQEIVPLLRTVGPSADCDFCRVERNGGLWLMPLIIPNNLNAHRTGHCTFVATLQARSTLVDSEFLRILVAWDGGWDDGVEEMKSHLNIKPA